MEGAIKEATLLVRNKQLWVHEIRQDDAVPEIASIVAVTRESNTVSAITKVYTNPQWRRRGCAERLVRRVCKQ
jgi:predicted GNAT family acetyltransferase